MHVPVKYAEFCAGIKNGKKRSIKIRKRAKCVNHKHGSVWPIGACNLTYTGGRDCPEKGLLEMARVNKKRIESDRILP